MKKKNFILYVLFFLFLLYTNNFYAYSQETNSLPDSSRTLTVSFIDEGMTILLMQFVDNNHILSLVDTNLVLKEVLTISSDFIFSNILTFPEESEENWTNEVYDRINKKAYKWNKDLKEFDVVFEMPEDLADINFLEIGSFHHVWHYIEGERFYDDEYLRLPWYEDPPLPYILVSFENQVLFAFEKDKVVQYNLPLMTDIGDDESDWYTDFDGDNRRDFIWVKHGKVLLSSNNYKIENLPIETKSGFYLKDNNIISTSDNKIVFFSNGKMDYKYLSFIEQFQERIGRSYDNLKLPFWQVLLQFILAFVYFIGIVYIVYLIIFKHIPYIIGIMRNKDINLEKYPLIISIYKKIPFYLLYLLFGIMICFLSVYVIFSDIKLIYTLFLLPFIVFYISFDLQELIYTNIKKIVSLSHGIDLEEISSKSFMFSGLKHRLLKPSFIKKYSIIFIGLSVILTYLACFGVWFPRIW